MDRKTFKNKLKTLGISQKEFATLTGCAYSTVKNWQDIPKWADVLLNYMETFSKLQKIKNTLQILEELKKGINTLELYKS